MVNVLMMLGDVMDKQTVTTMQMKKTVRNSYDSRVNTMHICVAGGSQYLLKYQESNFVQKGFLHEGYQNTV